MKDLARDRLDESQSDLTVGGGLNTYKESLAGHTDAVGAFAAQEPVLNEDRGHVDALSGVLYDVLPRWPAANNDNLVDAGLLRYWLIAYATVATYFSQPIDLCDMSSLKPPAAGVRASNCSKPLTTRHRSRKG